MITEQRRFFTPDGKHFGTRTEAEEHVETLKLNQWLQDWFTRWNTTPRSGDYAYALAADLRKDFAILPRER